MLWVHEIGSSSLPAPTKATVRVLDRPWAGAQTGGVPGPKPDESPPKGPLVTNRRTLALRKETLVALDTDELSSVVGGSHQCVTYSVLVTGCFCTGIFPSLNVDCPSVNLNCPR